MVANPPPHTKPPDCCDSAMVQLLSTQNKITYTEKFVGEIISRNVTDFFPDLPLIRINF